MNARVQPRSSRPPRRVLIVDNYDSFTWNLVQELGRLEPALRLDQSLVIARNDEISPASARGLFKGRGPTHVIISPGPHSPRRAGASNAIIRVFLGRVPLLGVCLGHQCLAAHAGMTIVRHPSPEHGSASPVWHDGRGIFAGLPSPMTAARYHSLMMKDGDLPPGWEVSAWTRDRAGGPRVVMGLRRVGSVCVEGVQFHPESFLTPAGPALLGNFLAMKSP